MKKLQDPFFLKFKISHPGYGIAFEFRTQYRILVQVGVDNPVKFHPLRSALCSHAVVTNEVEPPTRPSATNELLKMDLD